MAPAAILLFACFTLGLVTLVIRLSLQRRSPVAITAGLLYSVVFAGLSYYALVETQALSWTFGYFSVSTLLLVLALRNCFCSSQSPDFQTDA